MENRDLHIKSQGSLAYGYNSIIEMNGRASNMLMDFGIYKMKKGEVITSNEALERAFLLMHGEVVFEWENNKVEAKRQCLLKKVLGAYMYQRI